MATWQANKCNKLTNWQFCNCGFHKRENDKPTIDGSTRLFQESRVIVHSVFDNSIWVCEFGDALMLKLSILEEHKTKNEIPL
jgi:hypothetical protein